MLPEVMSIVKHPWHANCCVADETENQLVRSARQAGRPRVRGFHMLSRKQSPNNLPQGH